MEDLKVSPEQAYYLNKFRDKLNINASEMLVTLLMDINDILVEVMQKQI